MNIISTKIEGVYLIKPKIFNDDRGSFFESFNMKVFQKETNQKINFVQDNQSVSSKNILRGLHFQKPPHAQAKLVRVIKGCVLDVVVDLRKKSKTYGKYLLEELSEYNNHQLYLPKGMAHGFLTLEDNTIFTYKCSEFYCKEAEDSIIWNDSSIRIKWPDIIPLLSKKDLNAKKFSSFVSPF
ncbi:MAG: dTDP-4-dehydrorhamnose 3,5-epimerase [Flavobacteriales bacterium]|nr:dTDP-4-dehydrorhamnose 3,5-epimerase [Flavobacteriales bacterium]